MKVILADVNIQGYADLLVATMQAEPWKLFWDHLALRYFRFTDVGLALDTSVAEVGDVNQHQELALVTDNRNEDDPASLGATIRARNTANSLPVLTIANVSHLRQSREYADRIIDKLFDFQMRIDTLRGVGRLFLP